MTPLRALSIGCALAASRRWPALACVAGLLGVEAVAGDVSALLPHPTLASLAWGSSSVVSASYGAHVAARPARWFVGLAGAHVAGSLAFASAPLLHMLTVATACACASWSLLVHMHRDDIGRAAVLMLLVGNVATSLLVALLGVPVAYDRGVVSTSNDIVHASIAGLALWTMRAR